MKRIEVIVQGKIRKVFMKEGHLRGSLSEFWRHASKILGRDISSRANSKSQDPGDGGGGRVKHE